MPDEDFVKMAPVYAAAGVAVTASSDTEEVNAGENDDALSDDDIFWKMMKMKIQIMNYRKTMRM